MLPSPPLRLQDGNFVLSINLLLVIAKARLDTILCAKGTIPGAAVERPPLLAGIIEGTGAIIHIASFVFSFALRDILVIPKACDLAQAPPAAARRRL